MGDYFGIDYVEGNSGFFWTHNDSVGRILDGVVLIQSDPGSDTVLRHTLLEELTQVMGPMRDQALYADSVFYEKNGVSGYVTQLTQIDARILAFLYMYLEPGDAMEELLQKFIARLKNTGYLGILLNQSQLLTQIHQLLLPIARITVLWERAWKGRIFPAFGYPR
ncbi:MAG: DUF2927 domain-containing protein [Bdellovibrionota bacterium]